MLRIPNSSLENFTLPKYLLTKIISSLENQHSQVLIILYETDLSETNFNFDSNAPTALSHTCLSLISIKTIF